MNDDMSPIPDEPRNTAELDDFQLVRRAQNHDMDAFSILIRRHQGRAFSLAWRLTGHREDARDLVQEAFVRAWTGLAEFRNDSRFGTWLHRILLNLARNRHRDAGRKGRDRVVPLADFRDADGHAPESAAPASGSPRDAAVGHEVEEALAACLDGLPEQYREAFVLRIQAGMDYAQIAENLDCPLGTVKSRICGARRLLAQCLEARGVLSGDRP